MSFWGNNGSVRFPNLGLEFTDLPRGIAIGSFQIAFYGVIIAAGMLLGLAMARRKAKKTGQDVDIYLDCALWAIPLSVLGARIYEVVFDWDSYKGDFWKIIDIRNGGLAIYGGIIVAVLTVITYCRIKKLRFTLMADTAILGLILGQIIGRWGNFFNRECFGKYSDGLLAMQIEVTDTNLSSIYNPAVYSDSALTSLYEGKEHVLNNILEIRNNIVTLEDGRQFVQVHPTFLYESLWNLFILMIMIFAWPRKKFNGEIILIYMMGYGLGRFFIENIRTDQLFIWGTGLAASQVLSALVFIISLVLFIIFRTKAVRSGESKNVSYVLSKVSPVQENADIEEEKIQDNTEITSKEEQEKADIAAEENKDTDSTFDTEEAGRVEDGGTELKE